LYNKFSVLEPNQTLYIAVTSVNFVNIDTGFQSSVTEN